MLKRSIAAAVVTSLALASAASASPAPSTVLVSASSADALPQSARFSTELAAGLRTYVVPVPSHTSAQAYAEALGRRPGVHAAQPNWVLRRSAIAGACADVPDPQQADKLRNEVAASAVVPPEATKPIAILDTGVDPQAPGLSGRVLPGFNAVTDSADTTDTDAHGTQVAAVAASTDGRFKGISPTSQILPITIYNISSETTVDWVVKGIKEAVARGAGVINISSSNPAKDVDTKQAGVLDQAITEAFDAGVVVVVAAGNEGKGDAAVPGNLTKVINVGSATAAGTRDPFSNFGPWLDMMSPGNGLVLPSPKAVCSTGYGNATGTSFSAPAVAGAAALIGGSRPELSMQQLAELLRTGATKDLYTAGRDDDSGFGLLEVSSGLTDKAPNKQPTEVDDDVFWVKKDPKKHPVLLRSSRRVSLKSGVTPGKDPQDVFPVRLKRGELVTATATTNSGLMGVTLYSPRTGSFAIGDGSTSTVIRDSGGFTTRPQVVFRARSTGTYYLSVAAPDPPDPNDPNTADDTSLTKPISYTFSVRKSAAPKKSTKKTKKK